MGTKHMSPDVAIEYLCNLARTIADGYRDENLDMAIEVASEHVLQLREQVPASEPSTETILKIVAQIHKVQTLVDGGMRISLDTGEEALHLAGRLAMMAAQGSLVAVAMDKLGGSQRVRPRKTLKE